MKKLKSAILLDEKLAIQLEVHEAKKLKFYMFSILQKPENPGRPVLNLLIAAQLAYPSTLITIYNITSNNYSLTLKT